MTMCNKCGKREATYIAPDDLCEPCWLDWWVAPVVKDDARKGAAYRRESKRNLKKIKKEERRDERRERHKGL